jgi:hypothetical protein
MWKQVYFRLFVEHIFFLSFLDPFNRMPLKIEMVEPVPELKIRISQWLDEKLKQNNPK